MAEEEFQFSSQVYKAALQVLQARGWYDSVLSTLSADKVATLDNMPRIGFVDGTIMEDIIGAVLRTQGERGLELFSRDCTRASVETMRLHKVLEALLRIIGPSPALFLGRMNTMNTASIRGARYDWTSETPNSGYVDLTHFHRREIPQHALLGITLSLRSQMELIGRPNTEFTPFVLEKPGPPDVTYRSRVRW